MSKVRTPEPEEILSPVIGKELARLVILQRNARARAKSFGSYRAKMTLERADG